LAAALLLVLWLTARFKRARTAASTLHLKRPLDQSAWRIVGKTHGDTTRLVLNRGRATSDCAIALELLELLDAERRQPGRR
jgi:hypothetical protein